MGDHNYIDSRGNRIPVAQLPTEKIRELLTADLQIYGSDGVEPSLENVRERLRIELLIRELGL